ncbi:MAG: TM0106 family RecB-like putative nuclease [Candidatus Tectomicrobia bacterium]|uniref:TM0106 family RecB-like putative nuclease n=1 Tax=Tectimicrobiota bacterium TaxID=2528274 RepID=A0A932CNY0_UNCTE|nr:TM0106 family RecB-like putative nuclease [Candidatus Tectomicrobia bacterium]
MEKLITGNHFYQYAKCPYWAYLEFQGDPDQKKSPNFLLQKIRQEGLEFKYTMMSATPHQRPSYESGHYPEGFQATWEMMRSGVERIGHGVLMAPGLMGIPDILEKVPGPSGLGDYHYRPIEIKSGRFMRRAYLLQVLFYAHLLEKIQGRLPETVGLILRDKGYRPVSVAENYPLFQTALQEVQAMAQGTSDKLPHISSLCKSCAWEDACRALAHQRDDLSLVPSLPRQLRQELRELGIETVSQLARLSSEQAREAKAGGVQISRKLRLQAKALADNRVFKVGHASLPKRPVEVFFDIEGEQEQGVAYLFGMLVRRPDQEEHYSFVAHRPEEEGKVWREFLDLMASLDDFVIYHYHTYEPLTLQRMKEKYGADPELYEKVHASLVDLFKIIKKTVILPTLGYSLKEIAKWLGFRWSHNQANAVQSMFWYAWWLKTGEHQYLNWSIEYNRDDCEATKVVKDWLYEWLTTARKKPSQSRSS